MIIGISGKIGSGKDTVGQIVQYLSSPWAKADLAKKDIEKSFNMYLSEGPKSPWEVKKFADKLKDMVCMLLGCTREQLENRDFKEAPLGEEWDTYGIQFIYQNGDKDPKIYGSKPTRQEAVDFEANERRALQWPNSLRTEIVTNKMTPRLMLQLLGTDCGREIIHSNVWVNSLMADYKPTYVAGIDAYMEEGLEVINSPETRTIYPDWLVTDTRFPNEAEAVLNKSGILIRVERGDGNTGSHPSETALDDYEKWNYVIDNNGTMEELILKVREILIKERLLPL